MLLATACTLRAQSPAPAAQDTQKLKIETALLIENFRKGDREMQKLSGNVRLRQEDILIHCDSAIMNGDHAILKGGVVIEQGDTVKIFSDSTHYRADTKQADLLGNVVLENGVQQLFTSKMHYDAARKIADYQNGATMSNGQSRLKSRRGYYHVNEKEIFLQGDVLATDPDFTMRTDTMTFNTEAQMVRFVAPTLVSQRNSKVYTEGGFYDIQNDFASFDKSPQFIRDGERGYARKMRYNGTRKEYTLEGSAHVENDKKGEITDAEVIIYFEESVTMRLKGDAHFRDSTRDIRGEDISYDSRNRNYQISGRGRVIDGDNIINADSIYYNDALGNGLATGRVEWVDTAGQFSVLTHRMVYNKKSDYLYAQGSYDGGESGRPLMKSVIDGDTLYMSAERLTSFKPDSVGEERRLLAYRDVRVYKSDLQASSDSLSFSTRDSIFWFYKIDQTPVIWSDTSQFSGDTIGMLLKNKKMDRIWLRQNSLVINSEDEILFNQIKGKHTTAYFRENEVRDMYVEGNGQAVYYALDDKGAYIGLYETTCSEMRLSFGNNKVEHVRFYVEPTGKFIPMRKAGKETKKLEGFFWETGRRPRSLSDL